MGNAECRQNTGRICSEDDSPALSFDDNFPNYNETTINRGTIVSPKPQLKFHSICGTNIILLRDGRVAKRRESFCKGLAFSNRPIGIGEIVCIRLCEVGNNWSGVMRFACPDLTSKGGYWAKSLAERFSVQGLILHFFINDSGEMHYGVNGVHKGLFLSGINVNSPLWTIVDIYGNSVAVEFVEAMTSSRSTQNLRNMGNSATSRSTASSTPPTNNNNRDARLRFHSVKGNNVVIQNNGTTAVRKHGEYYLGYVFTERPIRIGEKIVILVSMTEDAFSGSLAFGLTSCDPDQVPASHLPADSDELLERPEYWVCIKDVGASPQVDLDQPLSPAEYIAMRGHRASSEGAASAHGDSNDTSLYTLISPTTRLSRPSSAQWNMVSIF
uniref:NHR domain-containing protein n=1 Tax=Meloidogyne javanica TaxID=6303 RepID=A0A915M0G8_MELJA